MTISITEPGRRVRSRAAGRVRLSADREAAGGEGTPNANGLRGVRPWEGVEGCGRSGGQRLGRRPGAVGNAEPAECGEPGRPGFDRPARDARSSLRNTDGEDETGLGRLSVPRVQQQTGQLKCLPPWTLPRHRARGVLHPDAGSHLPTRAHSCRTYHSIVRV